SRRVRGRVLFPIGLAYAQLGRHRRAITIGREIRGTPTRAAYFTDLGRAYLDNGQEEPAVDALRRAVLDAIAMTAREPQLALLVRITEGFARADRPRETLLAVQAIRDP
ncbi:MAG: hypothetical protein QF464_21595, partial [Myxococcota bacterium]|nr:hypothetical protein [Myxococcota bacterium]